MALQTSGPISLSNIQAEFGGSNPISLSEYYGAAAGIPASGAISLSNFYGASASKVQNFTIPASWTGWSFQGDSKNTGSNYWKYYSEYPSYSSQTYPLENNSYKYPVQSFESTFAKAYGFNSIVINIHPTYSQYVKAPSVVRLWGSSSPPNTQNPSLDTPLNTTHIKSIKITKNNFTSIFTVFVPATIYTGANVWNVEGTIPSVTDWKVLPTYGPTDMTVQGQFDQYIEIEWV